MIAKEHIIDAVNSFLQEKEGFFLVDVEFTKSDDILVSIDNDSAPVALSDVVSLTKELEGLFGEKLGDYNLEVASAGLTAPLKMPRQYRKHLGHELEVLCTTGLKQKGELSEVTEDGIVLHVSRLVKPEGKRRKETVVESVSISYNEIKRATYALKV